MKDFDSWNGIKKIIEENTNNAFCKNAEVWWCSLGLNVGFEQDGKNELFERPVLVARKFNKFVFWGVPLSTKIKPENLHYLQLRHDNQDYSAIISQLRLYDSKRLQRKMYKISKTEFEKVIGRLHKELDGVRNV
ncbi:type II toxin-antitoxin system PemK/MazF family toxin [Candidatus Saccharibacteria bacterium]|nr:type II toxin-antitoxin system PemK/MazF family toxin [Candidatus Saccharibacteria bacterium]MBI3337897.1 type II toxin-antitoxin system PemK/MazF family toxin [Candidatus Saccharibacteria bacterium]